MRGLVTLASAHPVVQTSRLSSNLWSDWGRAGRVLGAQVPRLPESRLVKDDAALADLARGSIRASLASPSSKRRWLAQVDAWLAG